ncbi:alpha/beta hydrolase [Fredinandcohnia sp. QZ13]|uniref:alpha/beta hydrolase n=1 Tax=Fredinandcohnia sp. QZ13 TaxID=3073144 RepID=UPI002853140E|nr:alpha/beta hydrolase [Fredinandcohnia sp. QZ13]MDR4886356.1 alpha/beta hydrolase [Fredinandcohnia sp. QZ13]
MIHQKYELQHNDEKAELYTYILDNSPSIDPDRRRPMIVICPGGGYVHTSDREAEPVAIQMLSKGFHASILRYSVEPAVFPTSLGQLASAIGLIRDHAESWNVDPDKIIVMGFSAGGHLSASLGVFWNREFLTKQLTYSKEQIKPNGLILSYPVISSGAYAHEGSFKALLGDKFEDQHSRDFLSLENQVSNETPPTFLWHTVSDTAVPVENSMLFAQSLLKLNVPLEMHIYPNGVHGLSLGTEETQSNGRSDHIQPEIENWIEMAARWIKGL